MLQGIQRCPFSHLHATQNFAVFIWRKSFISLPIIAKCRDAWVTGMLNQWNLLVLVQATRSTLVIVGNQSRYVLQFVPNKTKNILLSIKEILRLQCRHSKTILCFDIFIYADRVSNKKSFVPFLNRLCSYHISILVTFRSKYILQSLVCFAADRWSFFHSTSQYNISDS